MSTFSLQESSISNPLRNGETLSAGAAEDDNHSVAFVSSISAGDCVSRRFEAAQRNGSVINLDESTDDSSKRVGSDKEERGSLNPPPQPQPQQQQQQQQRPQNPDNGIEEVTSSCERLSREQLEDEVSLLRSQRKAQAKKSREIVRQSRQEELRQVQRTEIEHHNIVLAFKQLREARKEIATLRKSITDERELRREAQRQEDRVRLENRRLSSHCRRLENEAAVRTSRSSDYYYGHRGQRQHSYQSRQSQRSRGDIARDSSSRSSSDRGYDSSSSGGRGRPSQRSRDDRARSSSNNRGYDSSSSGSSRNRRRGRGRPSQPSRDDRARSSSSDHGYDSSSSGSSRYRIMGGGGSRSRSRSAGRSRSRSGSRSMTWRWS